MAEDVMNREAEEVPRFDGPADPLPGAKRLAEFADKLRENFGEWALLGCSSSPNRANQRAYIIRHGIQKGFEPAGSFESESRTLFGEHRIYARYVGEGE